jgi:hypothetical protein
MTTLSGHPRGFSLLLQPLLPESLDQSECRKVEHPPRRRPLVHTHDCGDGNCSHGWNANPGIAMRLTAVLLKGLGPNEGAR